jgi:serine/threonine-protein kinase ATR
MAPTSHGRSGPSVHESSVNGRLQEGHGPPPSTLAAQLVENISASARSSRPDETAELKRLFSVIEKVKNQPNVLQTQKDRVDHNHMLIYVYARVQLEGIKWDDPLLNRTALRSDALRAITFFRVTIHETPEVLCTIAEPGSFLFRGSEPLWVWMFPKMLKMLGYSHSLDLTTAVETVFQEVYLAAFQNTSLWPLMDETLAYLRLNFTGNTLQIEWLLDDLSLISIRRCVHQIDGA